MCICILQTQKQQRENSNLVNLTLSVKIRHERRDNKISFYSRHFYKKFFKYFCVYHLN